MLNLVLEGPTFEVLVKAAHPVRPWGKDELLLEAFPDAAGAWTEEEEKKKKYLMRLNNGHHTLAY